MNKGGFYPPLFNLDIVRGLKQNGFQRVTVNIELNDVFFCFQFFNEFCDNILI